MIKKITRIIIFSMSLFLMSGCFGSVKSFLKDMEKQRQQEVLSKTEDVQMVKAFIENLPSAVVYASEIYYEKELDLKGDEKGQTTDTNADIYHPVRFFERHMNDSTKAFELWLNVVKEREGRVVKYNGKVAAKLGNYIYLPKAYPEERYYYSLAPAYIEFDNQGNMVSAFVKVLKTKQMIGGWVVDGHRAYFAYEFDVIPLKPILRKIQMQNGNDFFAKNRLKEITLESETENKSHTKASLTYASPADAAIIKKINTQNGTNFKTIQEVQEYMKKKLSEQSIQ